MKSFSAVVTGLAGTLAVVASGLGLSQSLDKLNACTALTEDRARLKCYDAEMGLKPHAAAAPAAAAPAAAPAPATAKRQSTPDDFGLQRKAPEKPAEAAPFELTARVKSVSTRPLGELRIELDNGQVWMETDKHTGETLVAGEAITVKPGRFGSFFLTRQSGPAVRVKRVL